MVILLVAVQYVTKIKRIPEKIKVKIVDYYKSIHWSGTFRILNACILQLSITTFYQLFNPIFTNSISVISYLLSLASLIFIIWIMTLYFKTLKK